MRCLDCGNKAKKDCVYYRCRSCCKGHGFPCQTHIKSTWVPISTRQAISASKGALRNQEHHQQDHRLPSSSSGFGGHFPAEVSGETTFKCVRVTTNLEENIIADHYAYETSISINGHVFKGILYDQGPYQPMMNVHDVD